MKISLETALEALHPEEYLMLFAAVQTGTGKQGSSFFPQLSLIAVTTTGETEMPGTPDLTGSWHPEECARDPTASKSHGG